VRVRPITDADLDACVALFEAVAAEGRWLATEAPIDRREVRARWVALVGTGEEHCSSRRRTTTRDRSASPRWWAAPRPSSACSSASPTAAAA
jgi:hypothetical protein